MVEFWVLSPRVGGAPTLEFVRCRLSLGAPTVVEIGDSAPAESLRRSRLPGPLGKLEVHDDRDHDTGHVLRFSFRLV